MSQNAVLSLNTTDYLDIRPELLPSLRKDVIDAKAELDRLRKLFAK